MDDALDALFDALALPKETQVEQRVAKALLVDRGELGAADRRLLETGLERLTWRATIKPTAAGVAAYADEVRDYAQLVVMGARLRPDAKTDRIIEVIHRAVAQPLVLLAGDSKAAALSVGLKRRHEREAARAVLQRLTISPIVISEADPVQIAFLDSLALTRVATHDLWSLHRRWSECAEAYVAGRITGVFRLPTDEAEVESRRAGLEAYTVQAREVARVRKAAMTEKRLARRLALAGEVASAEERLGALVAQIR
ncbi:DUF4391 domain-containing protein [Brevundimonas sp.]|uniref:DUF4391 domain-containing protein n=1 Tax=Brevundimonas sp. TaxID=1871086 RepID=UPI001E15EF79|nr:DUF4391 domain-containing protein [Brevundimonas sp.]MBA3999379.1 hypothetical protein [Brevundimonas sp.]